MIAVDEDAVICDMAETYHVLHYRELSPSLVATLCCGLSDDSRIKRKIAGVPAMQSTLLLAAAVDRLSFIAWSKTKDAEHGRNRPISIVESMMGKETEKEFETYDSAESYEEARRRILEDISHGNRTC